MASMESTPIAPTEVEVGEEAPIEDSPIRILESARIEDVTPEMIQAAINAVEPRSAEAQIDAEVILGIAAHVAYYKPNDIDLDEQVERAKKIYDREVAFNKSKLAEV